MSTPNTPPKNDSFWQKHLSEWRNTSLTQSEYCRLHNLRPDNFSYHKNKTLKKNRPAPSKGFIQIQLPQQTTAAEPLTLRFGNGTSLTGISEDSLPLIKLLAEVLA